MSIVAENVKQLESSYSAGGDETKNTSGHSLAVFQKVKPRPVFQASYATSKYLLKTNENVCLHKDSYVNICNSFVYNSHKLETSQLATNK